MMPTDKNTYCQAPNAPTTSFSTIFEMGRFLTVVGTVDHDGHVSMEPGFQIDYRRRMPNGQLDDKALSTAIILEFLNEKREMLTQCPIPLVPVCVFGETDHASHAGKRMFASSVRFPVDSHILRCYVDGKMMKEIKKPVDQPIIKLVSTPKETAADAEIITWEVKNKTDVDIQSVVLYSNTDGQSWEPITPPSSNRINSIPISFAHLPGGRAKLKVLATDGFSTVMVESPAFDVSIKGVRVSILGPAEDTIVSSDRPTWFHGQAYDYEKHSTTTDDMLWSSSLDGELGRGPVLSTRLSVGTHEITLECYGRKIKINIIAQSDRTFRNLKQKE